MKKILFLILVFIFIGCESPKKFNWDEILGEDDTDAIDADITADQDHFSDADSINNDIDTVIKDDDIVFDTDVQSDTDYNDMDEFNDSDFDADTDNDTDTDIDTDIVVELFCGDEKVSDGEMCDGNIITCSEAGLTGSTGTVTCNPDCSGWVTYPDKCTKSNQSCTGLPANAEWNTTSNINQTWNGIVWIPVTAGSYSTVASTEECKFKCKTNYTWSGSVCIANTKVFICSAKPSTGTVWNTVSSYTQTWTGSVWSPADSTTEYNTAPSTTACRYKCDTNYAWDGISCETLIPKTICTGQTLCHDGTKTIACPPEGSAYYGQDSQYAALGYCIPRSYTINGTAGSEVVIDNNTGLIWQRTLSTNDYTWQEAMNYCDGLSYAGQTDWRLPTRKELVTIQDYEKGGAIDTAFFPGTQLGYYWASSSSVENTVSAWTAYFNIGLSYPDSKTNKSYVRCVRGEEWNPVSSFEEYTVSGKVIVKDTDTGLEWTKEYATKKLQQALDYCETLEYGGYTDWRLPNIEELKTLIDDSKYNPASSFPGMPSDIFWSSSSYASYSDYAFNVDFNYGYVIGYLKNYYYYARCVR